MAFGVKNFVDQAVNTAVNTAKIATTNTIQKGSSGSFTQGLFGNYSEMTAEDLEQEYGMYLMEGERIGIGFKLVRDVLIFTDKRLILFDKQGLTGTKMRVKSINLFSVYSVTMETSGFGFDDCELTFSYIVSPNLKSVNIEYAAHKLEFPKNYPVQNLYLIMQELAYENCLRLNGLE